MRTAIRPALVTLGLMTALTGFAYPLAMTGVAQVAFATKADGSLIERDGRVVGSSLIGQTFTGDAYLHPRPSAVGYDASSSGGTNYGPTNAALIEGVRAEAEARTAANGVAEVPVDLVTASGSGLDPHISPASAELQIARVAAARGLGEDAVRAAIAGATEGRTLGVLGEPRVNVLLANLSLDEAAAPPAQAEAAEAR